ncbi:tetratricopeptide repeat protein [Acidithiobacillus thiooxidans]
MLHLDQNRPRHPAKGHSRQQPLKQQTECNTTLGYAYSHGHGVPLDNTISVFWWKKSADQGNVYAENKVGNAYYQGIGVPKSYAKAIYWWKKAAAHGGKLGRRDQKKIDRLEHS